VEIFMQVETVVAIPALVEPLLRASGAAFHGRSVIGHPGVPGLGRVD